MATTTATEAERLRIVIKDINSGSSSSISKNNKEYLDIMFEEDDSESMGSTSSTNLV